MHRLDILISTRCFKRMSAVGVRVVHDVRIAGFQLNRSDFHQHVACAHDGFLLHAIVRQQRLVHVVDIHIVQMHAVGL